jgi:hypothetical protein
MKKKRANLGQNIYIFHLSFGGRNSAKELPKIKEVTEGHKQLQNHHHAADKDDQNYIFKKINHMLPNTHCKGMFFCDTLISVGLQVACYALSLTTGLG